MSSNQIAGLPSYTFRVRLAQAIIAVLVLILDIVSLAILGGYGALGYGIFTPIVTIVITGYWYYASFLNQQAYNRWAILILDCWAVVWWLSMWAVLASWAAALGLVDSIDNAYAGAAVTQIRTVHALTAVAAVLGTAEFLLFVLSLVTFAIALHRTRCNERQSNHQSGFGQPQYQAGYGQQATRPKEGFEVSD